MGNHLRLKPLRTFVSSHPWRSQVLTQWFGQKTLSDLYLLTACPHDKYFISYCTISGMSMLSLHCLKIADISGNLKYALKIEYTSILVKETHC